MTDATSQSPVVDERKSVVSDTTSDAERNMKRQPEILSKQEYDVLVIGAGISGAFIAWDAALRGLKVALIEQNDFGAVTSANSMKTVHGGLRYLQDGNIKLVRKMINERKAMLRIAPHLVHPLPFLMPTTSKLMRSNLVMGVALKLNDLISFDRNQGADPQKALPNGRVLSRQESLELLPILNGDGITGAAAWYDAQIYNTERFLLSVLMSAAKHGAHIINYVEAKRFMIEQRRVMGVEAEDRLTGNPLSIRARLVINASGAWTNDLLRTAGITRPEPHFRISVAINLITRQILSDYAAAASSNYSFTREDGRREHRSNVLIAAPWRQYSIVGTYHSHYDGHPRDYQVTEEDIQHYLAEANTAFPNAQLTREDILGVHRGFLPEEPSDSGFKLVREAQIHDHVTEDGIAGLISAIGVKYTTARHLAEQTVDLALKRLHLPPAACRTRETPIYGGNIARFGNYLEQHTQEAVPQVSRNVLRRLIYNYGTEYGRVLKLIEENSSLADLLPGNILKAEVIHSVREELAQTLADVIMRRIEIGSAGYPGDAIIDAVAELMAEELDWSAAETAAQIAQVKRHYGLETPLEAQVAVS